MALSLVPGESGLVPERIDTTATVTVELAETTRCDLESAGIAVRLVELDDLDTHALGRATRILFMTSATGNGDAPFAVELFSNGAMAEPAELGSFDCRFYLGEKRRICAIIPSAQ